MRSTARRHSHSSHPSPRRPSARVRNALMHGRATMRCAFPDGPGAMRRATPTNRATTARARRLRRYDPVVNIPTFWDCPGRPRPIPCTVFPAACVVRGDAAQETRRSTAHDPGALPRPPFETDLARDGAPRSRRSHALTHPPGRLAELVSGYLTPRDVPPCGPCRAALIATSTPDARQTSRPQSALVTWSWA